MRRFLRDLTLFTCLFSAAFIAAECALQHVDESYAVKYNYFMENMESIELLVLGSSQSHYSIDPQYIRSFKSANLAHVGQSILVDELLFEKFVDEMDSLEILVLECSYHSLEDVMSENLERHIRYQRLYGIKTTEQRIDAVDLSFLLSSPSRYLPLLNPFKEESNINEYGAQIDFYPSEIPPRFVELEYDTAAIRSNKDNHMIDRHRGRDLDALARNKKRFCHLVEMALEHDLHIVITRPSLYETYLEERDPEKMSATQDFLDSLLSAQPSILLIDFNEQIDLDVHDFLNEDHLNHFGAEKVSRLLDQKVRSHWPRSGTIPEDPQ